VTKSFTATGLALLVDEGKLDWNTPVRETLPEFRLRDLVATEPAAWFETGPRNSPPVSKAISRVW
jgi:CubicO group peptidase (beta-lactamase class C family)